MSATNTLNGHSKATTNTAGTPKTKVFVAFVGGPARRVLFGYRRRLRGLFSLLARVVAELVNSGIVRPNSDSDESDRNCRTIVIDDEQTTRLVAEKTVEMSADNPATVEDVKAEISHLRGQVKFLSGKGYAGKLSLSHFTSKADEVEGRIAEAVFGPASKMRQLQLAVAEATDDLEAAMASSLEGDIVEMAARKGLDTAQIRSEIDRVWAIEVEPPKKLLEVRRNLQAAPKPQGGGQTLRGDELREKLAKALKKKERTN